MSKVLVGMSGGVDSSVAAYLLKEKGYEVEGLSLILWEAKSQKDFTTCCSLQAMEEAMKTADQIGIPHSTIDIRDYFIEKVIEPFIDAYTTGSTPNPCVLCNRFIKFPFLLKEAEKRGADYIATGHYARVEKINKLNNPPSPPFSKEGMGDFENSYFFLKKGFDQKKDQSYVLYVLSQDTLRRLILPLGYYKKNAVRKMAEELNLSAVKRAESQEICFIEDRNYFKFIEKLSPVAGKPGPIMDLTGKMIGTHKGIYGYTVGQRKGLGISSPKPFYVVKIDAVKNTVHVGSQDEAKKKEFFVEDLNWITPLIPPLERGDKERLEFRASVKVRSMMKDKPATIFRDQRYMIQDASKKQNKLISCILHPASFEIVRVVFDEPQWAPASGQSAVFYDEDIVIGGGVIKIPA